jgi:hypothetical protein
VTYARRDTLQDERYLRKLVRDEQIVHFVVGLPVHLDGRESPKSQEARAFGQWLAEVTGLLQMGFDPGLKPLQSLGYRHMTAHLNGTLSLAEAVRTLKRDTRRYAKRQMTWFAADPSIIWTAPAELPRLYPQIAAFLARAAEGASTIDKPGTDI